MSSSGRTGAQNGRCGGRLSGGKRAASALAHAPKVRVIGRATGGVRVVVQEESEQLPASPTAQAAKVMGIADAIADALNLSPGGLKVAKIAAASAYAVGMVDGSGHAVALSTGGSGQQSGKHVVPRPAGPSSSKKQKAYSSSSAHPSSASSSALSGAAPVDSSLAGGKRGEQVIVQPKAQYGAGKTYEWNDVVVACKKIGAGQLTLADLGTKDAFGKLKHRVPRTSINRWLKDDHEAQRLKGLRGIVGTEHWKVELEVRGRTSLSKPGPGTMLGAAENFLMLKLAEAAKKGWQYLEEEVHDLVLNTCIELKLKNPVNKQLYTLASNIRTLVTSFLQRCEDKGVPLIWSSGRKLSLARALKSNWEILERYSTQVASPALLAFQKKHRVMLTLLDVGNFDEAQVDLCDFAQAGCFLCLGPFGNNVIVPYDQSPHFTLKFGFIGRTLFVQALIKIGNDTKAPSPHHCQLLKDDRTLVLMQSENGWTNVGLRERLDECWADDSLHEAAVPVPGRAPRPSPFRLTDRHHADGCESDSGGGAGSGDVEGGGERARDAPQGPEL